MPTIEVATEKSKPVELFYEDAGAGRPVVLIHGWPLSNVMWEGQMQPLVDSGHRVIAYDRRGFGASDRPWDGYDYDTLTSDLNQVIEQLDLRDVSLVGFSMGGGEVARYVATHGTSRLRNVVLAGSVTPCLAESDDNPDGVDKKVFDEILHSLQDDRVAFLSGFVRSFYNWSTIGSNAISKEALEFAYSVATAAQPRATVECAKAFATTDFRNDMTSFDVPTLVIHGDEDQTVPFEASGKRTANAISNSQLVVINGAPHGMTQTHTSKFNQALLDFLNS